MVGEERGRGFHAAQRRHPIEITWPGGGTLLGVKSYFALIGTALLSLTVPSTRIPVGEDLESLILNSDFVGLVQVANVDRLEDGSRTVVWGQVLEEWGRGGGHWIEYQDQETCSAGERFVLFLVLDENSGAYELANRSARMKVVVGPDGREQVSLGRNLRLPVEFSLMVRDGLVPLGALKRRVTLILTGVASE